MRLINNVVKFNKHQLQMDGKHRYHNEIVFSALLQNARFRTIRVFKQFRLPIACYFYCEIAVFLNQPEACLWAATDQAVATGLPWWADLFYFIGRLVDQILTFSIRSGPPFCTLIRWCHFTNKVRMTEYCTRPARSLQAMLLYKTCAYSTLSITLSLYCAPDRILVKSRT